METTELIGKNELRKADVAREMKDVKYQTMQNVAKLVKELIGERSIRQTSVDAGIAASYISGILKCKYLPSAEIFKKLTAPEANPKNGVTLEDLMISAGYQENYIEDLMISERYQKKYMVETCENANGGIVKKVEKSECVNQNVDPKIIMNEKKEKLKERRKERIKFESMATGIICTALVEKNICYSNASRNNREAIGIRGYKPDLTIYVAKQPILEWWFKFRIFNTNELELTGHKNIQMEVRQTLAQLMFVEPNLQRKISLVINNADAFECILGYKNKLAYRGDLSVILIDLDSFSIIREEYLSHYKIDDTKSEFYISY